MRVGGDAAYIMYVSDPNEALTEWVSRGWITVEARAVMPLAKR